MSEDEFLFSNLGPAFTRGTINIEDRDGFREFEETELRALSIVPTNEPSGCTTVYQGTSRLDFSSICSLELHL